MNPTGKPIVIVAIGQAVAVFIAYCGGLIGEKFWEKGNDTWSALPLPHIIYFYAHYGLWLLLVPFAWSVPILVKENSPHSRWPVGLWFLAGVALAAVIGVTGLMAFFRGFDRMFYR